MILLARVTLLFTVALTYMLMMRRASAAARHLVCACSMAGALLLPLSLLLPASATPLRLAPATFWLDSAAISGAASMPVTRWLEIFWIAGAVLCLLRLGLGYGCVSRIVRSATAGRSDGLVFSNDGFVFANNGFVFSNKVSVPMVAGLWRPVILLPLAAQHWPDWQRTAALRHEQAHILRGDLRTSLIAHVVCAVYWFHPLAWVLARCMYRQQEIACDDAVLASGLEPAVYAEALIATARQLASAQLLGCQMTQKPLKVRIRRLFEADVRRQSSVASLRRIAALGTVTVVTIALLNGNSATYTANHRVFRIGHGVSAPSVLYKTDPQYTADARARALSGTDVLQVVIGVDGLAHDIRVEKALNPRLDRQAVTAIQKWRFHPAMKDGQPVAARAKIEVNFRLK